MCRNVCVRMVLSCATVRPSFTFMWTFTLGYSYWGWVSSSRCHVRPGAQEPAPFWSSRVWNSWACISTHRAHIRPLTRLTHPRQLWNHAANCSEDSGWRNIECSLINYPFLYEYGQAIFCLSLPSRYRVTAPGQYEYKYNTCYSQYILKCMLLGHTRPGCHWCFHLSVKMINMCTNFVMRLWFCCESRCQKYLVLSPAHFCVELPGQPRVQGQLIGRSWHCGLCMS